MRYKIYFILFVICTSAISSAQAQDSTRYRVELLVLNHINHSEEPREARYLEDFSPALDLLEPPEEEEAAEPVSPVGEQQPQPAEAPPGPVVPNFVEEPDPSGMAAADMGPDSELDPEAEARAEDLLNAVVHVPEMGPEMQDAWRRLKLSGPFRPLVHLAWEQGSSEPFPVLRVHDLEALWVEDPWAEQREALKAESEAADATAVFGDSFANEGDEPAPLEAEPLPDPIAYYRLDGTASLIRLRFLHLSLAIEWREPVWERGPAPVAPAPIGALPEDEAVTAAVKPDSFRLYRLEQSRPIRTGRMEYFDGPVIGVLAWVTEIEETPAEELAD